MSEEFKALTIHQKLEITIQEMIDRQIALHEALAEVELIFLQLAEKKYKGKKIEGLRLIDWVKNISSSLN